MWRDWWMAHRAEIYLELCLAAVVGLFAIVTAIVARKARR